MNRLNKIWILALAGAVLYWLSLPPMKFPWAAYLACACWAAIVAKECPVTRREYWSIWFAGALMWLALLQGIRLAYWPLYAGWVALSLYLGVYLPLFVGFARSLHQKLRFPLPIATSVAWVGCELIRAYFVTGFAACMLAHSQNPWPWMLPIASQLGGYGISFFVMLAGTLLYQWIAWGVSRNEVAGRSESQRLLASNITYSWFLLLVLGVSVYSLVRHDRWIAEQSPIKALGRVALIQDDMPTMFESNQDDIELGWQRYEQQTAIAAKVTKDDPVDLVVWPESTFSGGLPWIDWDRSAGAPPEFEATQEEFETQFTKLQRSMEIKLARIGGPFGKVKPKFLLGTDVWKIRSGTLSRYNAVVWLPSLEVDKAEYYAKQHLVMFGEYIPVVSRFPNLLKMFGMGQLASGNEPKAWQLPSGATISTSICFEDVLPHLVQRQVAELAAKNSSPDLLINVTNDAWFRGSSILDHHLNNAIMIAVENRRPMLVAANQGISAWIDGNGRLMRSLPRLDSGVIVAEPIPDGRWGLWQVIGDWPARCLALLCFVPWCLAFLKRKRANEAP